MKLVIYFSLVFSAFTLSAQDMLLPLNSNAALQVKEKNAKRPNAARHNVQGKYIIEAASKQLPFVDDFSTVRQRTFAFPENYVYDSILNASGPCLDANLITSITGRFHTQPSFDYTYNLSTNQIDSTPKTPILFKYFASTGTKCLDVVTYTYQLFPEYYTYNFNTTTGVKIDSQLVVNDTINPDTLVDYAPVLYRAILDTNWRWMDNYAFINNTLPVFPPTIGVATLDGLNEYGRPYDPFIQPSSYGTADYLTSVPLNLSSFTENDSIYLSFFYQPMGLGDYPDKPDSLVVEFKNEYTDQWDVIWERNGYNSIPTDTNLQFKQVLLAMPSKQIPITNYFYDGFQFRFRNKASLTGNNDHWHIDYVRLDKNRSMSDTLIDDIAFVSPMPSILKNYYTMPSLQFVGSSDLTDTMNMYVRNLNYYNNTAPATNFQGLGNETFPGSSSIYNAPIQTFNAGYSNTVSRNPQADFAMPSALGTQDSISILLKEWISPFDVLPTNDTISAVHIFSNELAYDDGIAEKAYGLYGDPSKIKKFAYEFNLNKPDTLTGFKIFFTNIDENVSDLVFKFNIWDSLVLQQFNPPDPIWESSNKKPQYIDSLNGFSVYRLDTALVVDKKIYFGWSQDDFRNLQIGYDRNSARGCGHYYIYTNATWKQSSICQILPGSVMIHLLFGDTSKIKPTHIVDLRKEKFAVNVYPNPTNGLLNFDLEKEAENYEVCLFDMLGRTHFQNQLTQNSINISNLQSGMYFVQIRDTKTNNVVLKKVLKTDN